MTNEPKRTQRKEERVRANAEPIKTVQIDFDLEARSIVESWVLSPSSARSTSKNVIEIVFIESNIITPPKITKLFVVYIYDAVLQLLYKILN